MKFTSIKHRLIVYVSIFLVLLLGTIAVVTYAYFRYTTKELVDREQFTMLSTIAQGLDDKLSSAHNAIVAVAKVAPQEIFSNTDKAQRWLDNRAGIRSIFTEGLTLFSAEGNVIVDNPYRPDRRGKNFAFRPYFQQTVATGKPVISSPYLSTVSGHPVIMMTAPVFTADGRLAGILCGRMDLESRSNFIGSLCCVNIGDSGYLYLFDRNRTMIVHPNKSRIMKQDIPRGVNRYYDLAIDGFEGTGETKNDSGQRCLSSFKRLKTTNWVVAADFPVNEAYRPIARFRNYFLCAIVVIILFSGIGTWLLSRNLTRDLERLARHLPDIDLERLDKLDPIAIESGDEVQRLAGAFNSLMKQLRLASSDLIESNALMKSVLNAAGEGIVGLDRERRHMLVNRAAAELFGVSADALIGKPSHALWHHSHHDGSPYGEDECPIYNTCNDGKPRIVPVDWFWRADGTSFPVRYVTTPIYHDDGTISGTVMVFTDISEQLHYEEELKSAKVKAEEASVAKSQFLANMSHEIRTPLNGVVGFSELCAGTELTAEQREFIDGILVSTEHLMAVVNDILDFSKIEAGMISLEAIPFRFRAFIGQVMKVHSLKAVQKGIELVIDIAPDIPDALNGDPGRLRQILINLLGNAIKFTETGEVHLVCRLIGQDAEQTELEFQVRDTGIGIPTDKLQLIFDPFSQADGTVTRRFGGTGLGLSICQQLVKLMGGEIRVTSEPGVSSTFTFNTHLNLGTTESIPPLHEEDCSHKEILIVDDNETNRKVLAGHITCMGSIATAVSSAKEALIELGRKHFDMVLTDLHMPEADGWDLSRAIRREYPADTLPILLMPSAGFKGDAELCRSLGINGYLLKPVLYEELTKGILAVFSTVRQPEGPLITRHLLAEESQQMTILVAEDMEVNQILIHRILEKFGHNVTVVANGRQAVDSWQSGRFDLILMDCQMPEMDGYEATQHIRLEEKTTGCHIPIIAMTANAVEGDRDRCLRVGMDDYLSKPVRSRDLSSMLLKYADGNNRSGL